MVELISNHKSIIVAVQFDALAPKLLASALELAKNGRFRVRAIHVSEPLSAMAASYTHLDGGTAINLALQIQEDQVKEAEQKLASMIKDIDQDRCFFDQKVVPGIASQVILEEANKEQCAYILTGAAPGSHRYIPKGISTALSLMARSPVPVIVVREGLEFRLLDKNMKILMADDLRSESESIVSEALSLAKLCEEAQTIMMQHCHVLDFDVVDLQFELSRLRNRLPDALRNERSADEMYKFFVERAVSALQAKFDQVNVRPSQGDVHYEAKVISGSVLEVLDASIRNFSPNIVVFGRHHTLHRHPWGIGKVPLHGLLSFNSPIMLVPATAKHTAS